MCVCVCNLLFFLLLLLLMLFVVFRGVSPGVLRHGEMRRSGRSRLCFGGLFPYTSGWVTGLGRGWLIGRSLLIGRLVDRSVDTDWLVAG